MKATGSRTPADLPHPRVTSRRGRAALILATVVALGASLLTAGPAMATGELPDGRSLATAAGSCWEIKQNDPSASTGIYWILTPALRAPEQFYCDMTTDGGGWVLIGRGREGWKEQYSGMSTPANVRNTPTGTAAFAPAQLPGKTVNGLLNGTRVDSLADGVRIRRAMDVDGTQWQEARFKFQSRDRWVWTFSAVHRVGTYSFDGVTGSGGQTRNFGADAAFRRVDTQTPANQGYLGGMAYGAQVSGSTSATSYLYSRVTGGARPFAQMFLRPQLRLSDMDFGVIADAGAPAVTQPVLPESEAVTTSWGVSGLANGSAGELNTEVQAFGQVGNTVYVGGNLRYVQRTEAGQDRVERPYAAAFDVNSGAFQPGFAPVLNNQVKAIAGLPDGRVVLGGQFSSVNGVSQAGVAIVDAATGATSGWQIALENRTTGGLGQVRGLSVQGNWLYIAGSFSHLKRVGSNAVSAWNGARINLTTGNPDANWNPLMNGTSVGVDASAQGDRAYFSGYFRQTGSVATLSASAIQTSPGAAVVQPVWAPRFSKSSVDANGQVAGNIWQLGVREAGGRVWLGGSEHSLFSYDRNTFERVSGSITNNGGDFQAVTSSGNVVVAGCHCGDWVYENAFNWSDVGTNWTQADKMSLLAAWDASTGKQLPEFSPVTQARAGYGSWALFTDSTGKLWAGGDFTRSVRAGGVNQWSGGFIRFAPRDAESPTAPGSLTATPAGSGSAVLSWGQSTDAAGSVTYEVLKENRVVAVTTSRTATVPVGQTETRYFVRSADAAGNRSATTAVAVVSPPSDDYLDFVTSPSDWKWRFDSAPLPAGWNQASFDDSSWSSGSSVLGFNTTGVGTDISVGAPTPRPLSAQFRTRFTVTDPSTVENGTLSVIANDGVIVYVNGTEIGRANLPAGTIGQSTYSTAAPRSAAAATNRYTFPVPRSLLVDGSNVIAASTHVNYRSTPDVSFDLTFTAERGTPPPPPAGITVTATATDSTTVNLAWTHPGGSTATEYRVSRDGAPVGTVAVPATGYTDAGYTDAGLTASTTYHYTVVGVDAFGAYGPPAEALVTTPAAPPDPHVASVSTGDTWKWRFSSDALPAGWTGTGFDDSTWSTGPGVLGLGSTGLGTDIGIGAPTPRPLSAQFRTTFEAPDPGALSAVELTVVANDGVVVWVNGVELGRVNLPAGALTQNTYATAAPRSAAAAANPVRFSIPVAMLTAGVNHIAAQTHVNYRSTPDLSFAATVTGTRK